MNKARFIGSMFSRLRPETVVVVGDTVDIELQAAQSAIAVAAIDNEHNRYSIDDSIIGFDIVTEAFNKAADQTPWGCS